MPPPDSRLELPVDRRRDARTMRMVLTLLATVGLGLMLGGFSGWLTTDLSADEVTALAALVDAEKPTVIDHDGLRLDPENDLNARVPPLWKRLLLGEDQKTTPSTTATAEWHSFVLEPDRPAYIAAAERKLAADGWDLSVDNGDPLSVTASKDGVTVSYDPGMTFGRGLWVVVEHPMWTVLLAVAALPVLALFGLLALGRREKRLPPRRQRLSLGLSLAASALLLPSAVCAPTPFAETAWSAGRLYDLRLGLLLNLGLALWIATVGVVTIRTRGIQYSGNAQPPG